MQPLANCVCSCNYLTPITRRRRSFPGRLSIPVDARSGIRTHEANATDLKSVPFDRSGIRALCLYVPPTLLYMNQFLYSFIYIIFFVSFYAVPAVNAVFV